MWQHSILSTEYHTSTWPDICHCSPFIHISGHGLVSHHSFMLAHIKFNPRKASNCDLEARDGLGIERSRSRDVFWNVSSRSWRLNVSVSSQTREFGKIERHGLVLVLRVWKMERLGLISVLKVDRLGFVSVLWLNILWTSLLEATRHASRSQF